MFEFIAQDPPPAAVAAPATPDRALASLPNVTVVTYPVEGRSRRGIREDMNRNRPEVNGQRHDARTIWVFQPHWRRDANGQCLPETAELTVTITVTLPELTTRDDLRRADREAWDRYFAALVQHEGNHVHIVNLGAEHIVTAMRQATTCETMEAAGRAVSEEVAAASAEYDRLTRHGATEGAVF